MNNIYIGDRQLEPDDEPEIDCWSCKREVDREAILDCDGCCPCCGVEIISDDDPGEPNEDPE